MSVETFSPTSFFSKLFHLQSPTAEEKAAKAQANYQAFLRAKAARQQKQESKLVEQEVRAIQEKAVHDCVRQILNNIFITFSHCFVVECKWQGHQVFALKLDPNYPPYLVSKTTRIAQEAWGGFVDSLRLQVTVKPTGLCQTTTTITRTYSDLKSEAFYTFKTCNRWFNAHLGGSICHPQYNMTGQGWCDIIQDLMSSISDAGFRRAAEKTLIGFKKHDGLMREAAGYFESCEPTDKQLRFQQRLQDIVQGIFKNYKEFNYLKEVIEILESKPFSESTLVEVAARHTVMDIENLPDGAEDNFKLKTLKNMDAIKKLAKERPVSDYYEDLSI